MSRRSADRGRPPAELTRWTRARVAVMTAVLLLALGATAVRAVGLQVMQRARLTSMASDQNVREMEIPARRGDIYDRHGIPLAQSVEVDSLWIDPSMAGDLQGRGQGPGPRPAPRPGRAPGPAPAWPPLRLGEAAGDASRSGRRGARWRCPGLGVTKEPKRFYPQRELGRAGARASSAPTATGVEGLELAFEDELSGRKRQDAGHPRCPRPEPPPPGRAGIDGAPGRDRHPHPRSADPVRRGEGAGPRGGGQPGHRRDAGGARPAHRRAAGDGPVAPLQPQQPGRPRPPASCATARRSTRSSRAAPTRPSSPPQALDDGLLRLEDTFDCENGAWEVGKYVIHDTHPHGHAERRPDPRRLLEHRGGQDRPAPRARGNDAHLTPLRLRRAHRPGASRRGQGQHSLPQGGCAAGHPGVRAGAQCHRGPGGCGLRRAGQQGRPDAPLPGVPR